MAFRDANGTSLPYETEGPGPERLADCDIALDRHQAGSVRLELGWIEAIKSDGMRRFVDAEMAPNAYPPVLRRDAERLSWFRGHHLGNDPHSFAATYGMLLSADLAGRLGEVACPTLLVAGRHDVPRSPDFVAGLVPHFAQAQMAVVEGSHFMVVQIAHLVADVMTEFLERQSGCRRCHGSATERQQGDPLRLQPRARPRLRHRAGRGGRACLAERARSRRVGTRGGGTRREICGNRHAGRRRCHPQGRSRRIARRRTLDTPP
jgi:hypothetical protein